MEQDKSPVIPSSRIVAPVHWGIETLIRRALQQDPGPGAGLADHLFVPRKMRSQVLQRGHSSHLAVHPGYHLTYDFLGRRFWWPEMEKNIKSFVAACPVCVRSKTQHQHPQGLLHPLPVPGRPWSDLSVDFITSLPPSEGNIVILVAVDKFYKACCFILKFIPKLPSAFVIAKLMFDHVF